MMSAYFNARRNNDQ